LRLANRAAIVAPPNGIRKPAADVAAPFIMQDIGLRAVP
jgi:hypothetical protein